MHSLWYETVMCKPQPIMNLAVECLRRIRVFVSREHQASFDLKLNVCISVRRASNLKVAVASQACKRAPAGARNRQISLAERPGRQALQAGLAFCACGDCIELRAACRRAWLHPWQWGTKVFAKTRANFKVQ